MPEPYPLRLWHAILRLQHSINVPIPTEIKRAGAGRKAKLIFTGEEPCSMYMKWTGEELIEEFNDNNLRNIITMHEQTLLDLIGNELDIRDAVAARLITVEPEDNSLYDEEEIVQLLKKLISEMRRVLKVGV